MYNIVNKFKECSKCIYIRYIVFFLLCWLYVIFRSPAGLLWIDPDYHYAMVAISNHWTPDVQEQDIVTLDKLGSIQAIFKPPYSHFEANGKYYGNHFWFWSLLCVPIFNLLSAAGQNPLKAHELTFWALSAFSLFIASRFLTLNDRRKTCFLVFVTLSPILWLTQNMGSEAWLYSCMIMAVSFISCKRYDWAALAVSAASLQNAAYMPLAISVAFLYLMENKFKISSWKIIFYIFPLLISPGFYLITAGTWNPIADLLPDVRLSNVNFNLFLMLLLDFNQGLIIYIPFLVLTYVALLIKKLNQITRETLKKRFNFWKDSETVIVLIPVIISLLISIMVNWNCGRVGVNRYALPLIPFISYSVCKLNSKHFSKIFAGSLLVMLYWFAFISNGVINYSWVRSGVNHGYEFNSIAKLILRYAPSLYPAFSDETFIEPTLYRDFMPSPFISRRSIPLPVIYYDKDFGARKMVTTRESAHELEQYFHFENAETLDYIREKAQDKTTAFYINFPAFRHSGEMYLKSLSPEDVRYAAETLDFSDEPSELTRQDKTRQDKTRQDKTRRLP